MGLRSTLATQAMGMARAFGNMLGCEIAVDVSGHSIETRMVPPVETQDRAWDDDLYVQGNLFVDGYANPIKPKVVHNEGLDNPDEVDMEVSESDDHVKMISSPRYGLYMMQDLVSQLLNPSERLTMIQWILVGIAGMLLMTLVVVIAIAAAVGVF